jgi:hypothetical protein
VIAETAKAAACCEVEEKATLPSVNAQGVASPMPLHILKLKCKKIFVK